METSDGCTTALKIMKGFTAHNELIKNPPPFMQQAVAAIRSIEDKKHLQSRRHIRSSFAEQFKIKCAKEYFKSLGVSADIRYLAPVAEYGRDFKAERDFS